MVRIHFRSVQINVNIYHAIRQQPPYSLPFVHFSFSTIRFFLLPLRSFYCRNFSQRRVQSLSAPHVFFHLNPHVLFLSIYFAMCYLDLNLLYRFFFAHYYNLVWSRVENVSRPNISLQSYTNAHTLSASASAIIGLLNKRVMCLSFPIHEFMNSLPLAKWLFHSCASVCVFYFPFCFHLFNVTEWLLWQSDSVVLPTREMKFKQCRVVILPFLNACTTSQMNNLDRYRIFHWKVKNNEQIFDCAFHAAVSHLALSISSAKQENNRNQRKINITRNKRGMHTSRIIHLYALGFCFCLLHLLLFMFLFLFLFVFCRIMQFK